MISQRIRDARRAYGWSVEELARLGGIPPERIARLEKADLNETPLYVYSQVCPLLGIELPEFCTELALGDPVAVGKGLQTLRSRLQQSQSKLATLAGISKRKLAVLEAGNVDGATGEVLSRLAGALGIALTHICFIVFESKSTREFHVYGAGIGKSGTMSLARIFARYTTWHEFLSEQTMRRVLAKGDSAENDEAMDEFLRARDRLGNLELDSAGYHANYIEHLVRIYPDAKFIVTVRDCYSWLDSFLNTILNDVPNWPDWHFEGVYGSNFGLTRETITSKAKLTAQLPNIMDSLLRAWAHPHRRIFAAVPKRRMLVLRTQGISGSLSELAQFVGVPEASLDGEMSLANVRPVEQRHHLLESINEGVIEECVERTCSDLMTSLFPGHRLHQFLDRAAAKKGSE
jgi:transcriptional regulator with XRE-family HTH domain